MIPHRKTTVLMNFAKMCPMQWQFLMTYKPELYVYDMLYRLCYIRLYYVLITVNKYYKGAF